MHRGRIALVLALATLAGSAAARADGTIYKCMRHGVPTFQDHPCPGQAPDQGKLHGYGEDKPIDQQSPAELMDTLREDNKRLHDLRAEEKRASDALRERSDPPVTPQERRRLRRRWQQRYEDAEQQRDAVVSRLRELCPGGASSGHGQYSCRPDSNATQRY